MAAGTAIAAGSASTGRTIAALSRAALIMGMMPLAVAAIKRQVKELQADHRAALAAEREADHHRHLAELEAERAAIEGRAFALAIDMWRAGELAQDTLPADSIANP